MGNLYSSHYYSPIDEGAASEHPDVKGQSAFAARADAILAARRDRRKRAEAARVNAEKYAELDKKGREIYNKSTIKREEFEMQEEKMTPSDIKKENRLKDKYDKSGMKASMIQRYGPEKGKSVYFATIRKKAMKEAIELDEAKLSRTERRARNIGRKGYDAKGRPTPKGGVHAFDVDETLFSHGVKGKPNVKVHVKDASGKRVQSLTNQQFNTHKLEPGHSYDFSEFRNARKFAQTASPNKRVIKKIKKLQRRGQNVHLITARDKFDNPEELRQHFVRHGINVKPGQIHYTGGMRGESDIGKNKVSVARGIAKMSNTGSIHMYDDAAKVHKAFEAEKGKSRKLRIKTHLAKPNKKGEVMLRSYQATKENFELWIDNLLDEGYDLSEFTVDELYETFEYILDEAITAVAAPAPGGGKYNKGAKKQLQSMSKGPLFKSPYAQGAKTTKKSYKEEADLTPYEFWKSFIIEDQIEDDAYDLVEDELDEEIALTPYDAWKMYFSEKYINEESEESDDDGPDSNRQALNLQTQMKAKQRAKKRQELAQHIRQAADELEN